jgi:hypothetical protein
MGRKICELSEGCVEVNNSLNNHCKSSLQFIVFLNAYAVADFAQVVPVAPVNVRHRLGGHRTLGRIDDS